MVWQGFAKNNLWGINLMTEKPIYPDCNRKINYHIKFSHIHLKLERANNIYSKVATFFFYIYFYVILYAFLSTFFYR